VDLDFPSDWQLMAIESCMSAIIDYRGKSPQKTSWGIPLITAKIVKDGRILPPAEYIDPEDYDDWMGRGLPKAGDVVITTEAPLGEVAQLDSRKVALAQRLITLRGKREVLDNNYLKYALQSELVQGQLKARGTGTTVIGIRQSELRKVKLPIPILAEQKAIAHILGTLDDKIELNRRLNETLEAMARVIFKSWFVDFDPVRAKSEGRQPEGLDPDTAALFPDSFEDSDLSEIPRGWKIYHLPEIFEINPSRQLSKGNVAPYLDMASMPTQGHAPASWIERELGSGMKFINGDTLVARITPCLENGKTAFVDFLTNGVVGWGSTEYIVLRPREPIPPVFAYLLARSNEFRTFAIQRMTGSSGRQRVPADSLSQFLLAAPAIDSFIFDAFGRLVNTLFERVRSGMNQSRTLAAIRDALLPKLLSGVVRVKDVEEFVEAKA
jgi:type I restriction enzyme S subunit